MKNKCIYVHSNSYKCFFRKKILGILPNNHVNVILAHNSETSTWNRPKQETIRNKPTRKAKYYTKTSRRNQLVELNSCKIWLPGTIQGIICNTEYFNTLFSRRNYTNWNIVKLFIIALYKWSIKVPNALSSKKYLNWIEI